MNRGCVVFNKDAYTQTDRQTWSALMKWISRGYDERSAHTQDTVKISLEHPDFKVDDGRQEYTLVFERQGDHTVKVIDVVKVDTGRLT